ncbi:lysosomal pro-x carboxypeptidase [Stylonychia lemnae]|uniref:Lysosomal pro-x carboxypeptidase n=1 Tax=Stylonychia lemnae TaxID=5949 RepID=A0A078A8V2_STYLE|nr:lysosomal pro-x carboxypeptidase [Stylonychia lemnae]|eukprot:CDW78306.1 lysosomal pro-x carboxypeptidase [Stylonychia lemnae]
MKQLGYQFLALLGLVSISSVYVTGLFNNKLFQTHENQAYLEQQRLLQQSNRPADSFFDVDLDHFVTNGASSTFKLRYLIDESNVKGNDAPILFYCGNEAEITIFWDNLGYVTDFLAHQMNAVVLFGEHRYYGSSKPMGDDSFKPENVKFLTVEQVMMDYVKLIKSIKSQDKYKNSAVIAFGGSYGGMLASWIRMKYPHIIQGAHAASAPILFFPGAVSPYAFNELVTRTYRDVIPGFDCSSVVKKGLQLLNSYQADKTHYQDIKNAFNTCDGQPSSSDQVQFLLDSIPSVLGNMAMVNYPYPTSFIAPLPGNPVKAACTAAGVPASDLDYINSLAKMYLVFTNYSGQSICTNLNGGNQQFAPPDTQAWDYQTCQEFVTPIFQSGKTDMFLPEPYNPDLIISDCAKKGLIPQFDYNLDTFGGRNINKDFAHISNIIFSNGDLDPWRAGGIPEGTLKDNKDILIRLIKGGAHLLDLRAPNKDDPQDLTDARTSFTALIQKWVSDYADLIKASQKETLFIQ